MKRTVGALLLVGGLGGCVSPEAQPGGNNFNRVGYGRELPGYVAPGGEPVHASRSYGGTGERRGLLEDLFAAEKPATARGAEPAGEPKQLTTAAKVAPKVDPNVKPVGGTIVPPGGLPPGPPGFPPQGAPGRQALGPPGAVAAVGALPVGAGPQYTGQRSEVRFSNPPGMKVTWFTPPEQGGNGRNSLETPGRYNFLQGGVYRLKLSDIALRPGLELYPTLEVFPCSIKTGTFLAHSAIPVAFTDEDFEQVVNGNLVVKVIYLPDPQFQDLAVAGPDEVVSTRLEPGADPILEASRRGHILAIVRVGNIDLEAPGTPPLDAGPPVPPGIGRGGPALPPGGMIPAPALAGRPPVPAAAPVSLPPSVPPTAGRASITMPSDK